MDTGLGQDELIDWGERHSEILDRFLVALEEHNVRYFILRNYVGLPRKNPSKDVDIVVDPKGYNSACMILRQIFESHRLTSYSVIRFERAHCWYGFDIRAKFSIHLDLITGYSSKGFEYIGFGDLYKGAVRDEKYWVLSEPFNIIMLILYKAIGVRELSDRYREVIREQYLPHRDIVDQLLIKVFGVKVGTEVGSALGRNDFDWIITNARELSWTSKARVLKRKPIRAGMGMLSFLVEKMDRLVYHPKRYRRLIAVLGPDGSGKTTFIHSLQNRLASQFRTDVSDITVKHFRPGTLPNLGRVGEAVGGQKQDTDFSRPHRNPPAGTLSSLMRMVYYWLDYIVGGFTETRRDAQFSRFRIYDRYIFDFLIDPGRSRIALPYSIRLAFAKATYQPNLVFVLKARPETVLQRKQELTLDEIVRVNKELVRLESVFDCCVEIDANETTAVMVDQAIEAILTTFTKPLGGCNG